MCTTLPEVYSQFKSPQPCAGCGVKPRSGTYLTRHSPDASTVTRALHEDSGFDGIIRSTDVTYAQLARKFIWQLSSLWKANLTHQIIC